MHSSLIDCLLFVHRRSYNNYCRRDKCNVYNLEINKAISISYLKLYIFFNVEEKIIIIIIAIDYIFLICKIVVFAKDYSKEKVVHVCQ